MQPEHTLFQFLWTDPKRFGDNALLMEPATERIHRPEPAVAGDRLDAPLAEVDHELLEVGAGEDGSGRRPRWCVRLPPLERLPRGLIPLAVLGVTLFR